jgi:hypothetical protein
MNWWVDLLTTYTHPSELQSLTVLSLSSTIHKSLHTPSESFCSLLPSSTIPWQRLVTVEMPQLNAPSSYLHSLPRRTQLSTNNSQAGGHFTAWLPTDSLSTDKSTGSKSKSKSELLYDWRFTANQFVLASSPLRPTTTDLFFNWALVVIALI